MIKVMIVEDDPMVAELNRRYLEQTDGFQLTVIASNGEQALKMLEQLEVDLIMLDIYMPGINGLELLKSIRSSGRKVDVIVVSAARDSQSINEALRQGAADYLIKPFTLERMNAALENYRMRAITMRQEMLNQAELDKSILVKDQVDLFNLPKGLDRNTLKLVWENIKAQEGYFDTTKIADQVGISRVSARKYLDFLLKLEILSLDISYGKVGRPIYLYRCTNPENEKIKQYLG